MILDFKELPQANKADGLQDTFELFSRDFLEILGYEIVSQPDRGADGKKDLIVREARSGLSGVTYLNWLVSCKHYAHSGKSVSDMDEPNILDRVSTHACDGFIGFYSTLPATSLGQNLIGLKTKIQTQSFDREQIEKILFDSPQGMKLANRFFPISYASYYTENPKPASIFSDNVTINCEYCNKNLLEDKSGILVLLSKSIDYDNETENFQDSPYIKGYFSCKGQCDKILKNKYLQEDRFLDHWIDISHYLSPTGYLKNIMGWINSFQEGQKIEKEAFDKLKKLLLNTFPYISREQTIEEKEKVKHYIELGFEEFI